MPRTGSISVSNLVVWSLVACPSLLPAQTIGQLIPHKVKVESVIYRGQQAVKMATHPMVKPTP